MIEERNNFRFAYKKIQWTKWKMNNKQRKYSTNEEKDLDD